MHFLLVILNTYVTVIQMFSQKNADAHPLKEIDQNFDLYTLLGKFERKIPFWKPKGVRCEGVD
jgi:hypothetical protein